MNWKVSIPHEAFSFIVSEHVWVNPDNSLAECVNLQIILHLHPNLHGVVNSSNVLTYFFTGKSYLHEILGSRKSCVKNHCFDVRVEGGDHK